MKKTISLALLFFIAMLTGCATPSGTAKARFSALTKVKNDVPLVMEIPSANNAISNQMLVSSIKAGIGDDGPAVVNLVAILKDTNTKSIAVIGDNDAVTAATIEAALKRLKGFKSSAKLYFVGEASYGQALKVQADAAGISFEAVVYP